MTARGSPIFEALAILLAWRRVVLGCVVGATLVSLVYALVARPVYLARASILPKQQEGQLAGLSALVGNPLGAFAGSLAGVTTSTDVLMTILESRYLRERLVDRLDLIRTFKIKARSPERARQQALDRLEQTTRIGLTKRMSIYVEVRAGSPELAAKMANACFEELDRLNQEFAFTSARQTRLFIEQRLAETRDSLSAGQARLEQFQRAHGMVALEEQAKAEVGVVSRLQAELIGLQAQLDVQRQYSTESHSKTRDLQYRIDALRSRLAEIAGGTGQASPGAGGRLMISFADMPGLGRRLAELLLDVKTQEAVLTLLTTQYQQAKIDEARDVPTIQVLDRAEPPVSRHAPRRRQVVIGGLLGGFALGALLAFGFEYTVRALHGPSAASLRQLLGSPLERLEGWLARTRS